MTPQIVLSVATACLGLESGSLAVRHADETAEVSEWVAQAWAEAGEMPVLKSCSVAWREETYSVLSSEEFERLKQEVERTSEHPLKGEVGHVARHGFGVPVSTVVMRLVASGEGRWRFNMDLPPSAGQPNYIDTVLTDGAAWRMSRSHLEVFTPDEARRAGTPDSLRNHEFTFMPSVGRLLHGHFTQGRLAGVKPGPVEVQRGGWSFVASVPGARPEQAFAIEYRGIWVAGERRGVVQTSTVVSNGYKPETVGEREVFRDHRWEACLGRWVSGKVERFAPSGRLYRVVSLVSVDQIPGGEDGFGRIVAIPDPRGVDPFRGPVTFVTMRDHRTGAETERADDGRMTQVGQMVKPPSGLAWLRWWGWVMIGVCTAALLWIRSRR